MSENKTNVHWTKEDDAALEEYADIERVRIVIDRLREYIRAMCGDDVTDRMRASVSPNDPDVMEYVLHAADTLEADPMRLSLFDLVVVGIYCGFLPVVEAVPYDS